MDSQTHIVIVGAGVGGLMMGIALRRQMPGFDNFVIYEKAGDLGGTWRGSIYPGCAADIPVHFYSLSTDLNPNWDRTLANRHQIHAYWRSLAEKYDLIRKIIFHTEVISATWSSAEELYDVVVEETETGIRTTSKSKAKLIVSALGILECPRYPNIPGIEGFGGAKFHTGRYDTSVDLTGKRVAVIGNGASATQMIPAIAADSTTEVVEFCRSPNWFTPAGRREYRPWEMWVFKHFPLAMRLHRFLLWLQCDVVGYLSIFGPLARILHSKIEDRSRHYIQEMAPKEYHDRLIPSYKFGCRRIVYDGDYLASLHRPNVRLCWDAVDQVIETGIVTKTGDILPFDVLIFATGYVSNDFPLHIQGPKKTSVKAYYDANGGPTAYRGTTIPDFPNLCLIGGPNTVTGHTSFIFLEEVQVNYVIQLIKPILESRLSTFTVKHAACDTYNALLQLRLSKSVFNNGCLSWYRKGGDGKIASIFPGSGILFWWWLRKVEWQDYDCVRGKGVEGREGWGWVWGGALMAAVGMAVYGGRAIL